MRRRNYHTHDARPATLTVEVRPGDVPYLRPAARYALWSDKLQVRSGWRACWPARSACGFSPLLVGRSPG